MNYNYEKCIVGDWLIRFQLFFSSAAQNLATCCQGASGHRLCLCNQRKNKSGWSIYVKWATKKNMFCGFHLCRITGATTFSQCYLFLYLPFNTEEERAWHRARGKYYKTDLLASFCLLPMLFSFSPTLHNGKHLFRPVKRPDLNFLCVSSVAGSERVWNL